jgi:glycosyl transferase family 2
MGVTNGSTRCGACGYQELGVDVYLCKTPEPHLEHQHRLGPSEVYRQSYHYKVEDENIAAFEAVWNNPVRQTVGKPVVSIIMPTFKRQHTIKNTIGSILCQTFTQWELILVDNQPDNEYKFDDCRIKYVKHPETRGAAYGRNMGVQYISGDLVCFFDDDDIMKQNYLQVMTSPFLKDPKINMAICLVRLVEGVIAPHNYFCTPSVVVRKQYVTPSWTQFFGHDILFFSTINEKIPSESVVRIPEILVHAYTASQGGIREGAL